MQRKLLGIIDLDFDATGKYKSYILDCQILETKWEYGEEFISCL
jgi:hypothetical protein